MVLATYLAETQYRSIDNLVSKRYSIPSIAMGDDPIEYSLSLDPFNLPPSATPAQIQTFNLQYPDAMPTLRVSKGYIANFRVVCNSGNFNVSIRDLPSLTVPNIDEIMRITGIVQFYNITNMKSYFDTQVPPGNIPYQTPYLYTVITNNDVVATGTIYIELILSSTS